MKMGIVFLKTNLCLLTNNWYGVTPVPPTAQNIAQPLNNWYGVTPGLSTA